MFIEKMISAVSHDFGEIGFESSTIVNGRKGTIVANKMTIDLTKIIVLSLVVLYFSMIFT